MWQHYHLPSTLDEALALLAEHGDACRIIAGGTDLILEIERGVRRPPILVDISRVPEMGALRVEKDRLLLGPLVTHNQVVASADAVARAFPLASASLQVGAPQIRNRGTVVGNLVTASPANDTVTPLRAMDAQLILASERQGVRRLTLDQFHLGVRRTALAPDEMVIGIDLPLLTPAEFGVFRKLGLRRAQAISLVNVAAVLEFAPTAGDMGDADHLREGVVRRARIALGAVAPTIVRAETAEQFLVGRTLTAAVIAAAAELAVEAARPISDIRAEAWFRLEMVKVLTAGALHDLRAGRERSDWPEDPAKLWGRTPAAPAQLAAAPRDHAPSDPSDLSDARVIHLTVNGEPRELVNARGKTLLAALRDDLGLTGAKEGCAEGECGACTVQLDGKAVMSCLIPVESLEGRNVVTVEGLASPDGTLHPLQQAFIEEAAVQCGYCTPGMLMSGVSLLEELPQPTHEQIQLGLTGNLCRCTGYYSIAKAVERAASETR